MTSRSELDRKLIAAIDRLGRALRVARQQLATDHGLSVLQVQLIDHLHGNPLQRVGALAAAFDVTQPTVSDALTPITSKGLVDRRNDPDDGRASVIGLTSAGEALALQLASEMAPVIDDKRSCSADDEATALHVLLEEIRRLQHNGVITVNRSCLSCQHFQPANDESPAHCLLLDEPLLQRDLRVDCGDHLALI